MFEPSYLNDFDKMINFNSVEIQVKVPTNVH